jgi:cytochrome c oxidase cbb3-type subunit III
MHSRCRDWILRALLAATLCLPLSACSREQRRFDDQPSRPDDVTLSDLRAGNEPPGPARVSPYVYNAHAVSIGKQYFEWYNCVGCHAHGGGSIGPALMDDKWIYGSAPENIFATIVEGRPNGMPSFRGKLNAQQVWQIVAYVQSLSGGVAADVVPPRDDHLYVPWAPTTR